MNWRKFNKKSELWVAFLFLVIGGAQAVLFISDGEQWSIIGNILIAALVAFFSTFLTIYSNKTRINANTYLNEIVELYLERAYSIEEKKLEKESLMKDNEFQRLHKSLCVKYEMFKIYSNNQGQNEEFHKYFFEYEKMNDPENFLKFIKEEVTV